MQSSQPSVENSLLSQRRRRGRWPVLLLALLAQAGESLGAEPALDGHGNLTCERISFQVALAPALPADQTLVGWLCSRLPVEKRTVQVLLHGGTYDHSYWDFPLQP